MGDIVGGTGRALVITAALLAAPGCASLDHVLRDLPGTDGRTAVVDGEVRAVDARRGRLELRTARGRTHTVRVDRSTRVSYRRGEYRVDALERGDLVRVWLEVDGRGESWADRVEVRRSVTERDDDRYRDRVVRLEGRVGEVDLRRGYFTVAQGWRSETAVYLPEQMDKKERRRVAGLRRGESVSVVVRPVSAGAAELVHIN